MKRKILSLAVVFAMMFTFTPHISFAVSASDISSKLQSLKSQYPTGTSQSKFYNSSYGGDPCYKDLTGWCSWQCMAWGCKVYDTLWGSGIKKGEFHQNGDNLYVGDYIRYRSSDSYDHSIVVTNIVGDKVYYTDCNGGKVNNVSYSGKINWDRAPLTVSDIKSKLGKKLLNASNGYSYGYIVHYPGNTVKTLDASANYVNLGDGFWATITHPATGLAVGKSSTANIELMANDNSDDTKWYFSRQSDGTYVISAYKGDVMDVDNWGTTAGTNVSCVSYNGSTAQKWYVLGENGSYTIKSICADTVLDVASNHNIQMYTANNTAAQKFTITKITPFNGWVTATAADGNMPIYSNENTVFNFDSAGATYFSLYLFYPDGHGEEIYTGAAKTFSKQLSAGEYAVQISAQNNIGWTWDMGKRSFQVVDISTATPSDGQISAGSGPLFENEDITFTFDAKDASYYDLWLYKEDGTREEIYAGYDREITKKLPAGKYRLTLSARNNIGWTYEFAEVSFTVVNKIQKITFDKNGGVMDDTYRVSKNIDAINSGRAADSIAAFTTGSTTGTNIYGYEVIVNSDGLVTDTNYYVGNSAIPSGGMVLSGHGSGCTWLDDNIEIGDYVTLDTSSKLICVYSAAAWQTVNKKVCYGEKYGFLPTPTRDGYDFSGWYTKDGLLVTSESTVSESEAHTLVAGWTKKTPYSKSTVTKSGTNYTVNTTFSNLSDGKAYYAGYKLNKLYDVKIFDIASDKMPVTLSGDFDTIKVIVIDGNFTPVTEGEILKP